MAMSANSEWLDQLEEGNTAGGHAGEVEAIPYPASPRDDNRSGLRAPWTRRRAYGTAELSGPERTAVAKLSDEQRRALRLLAGHPTGCTKAFLLANGISQNQIDILVRARLATLEPSVTRMAGRGKIVVWVQIIPTGTKALTE